MYSQSLPLVEKEWLTAERISSGGTLRDLGARSDQRIGKLAHEAVGGFSPLRSGRERPAIGWQ